MDNMTSKKFQETLFYLLTLNSISFMLCKPPFSLSSLISSMLQTTNATSKPYKKIMTCSHPQLFITPYMYLFSKSDGNLISSCTKNNKVCQFCPNLSLDQYTCDLMERESLETNRCKNEDGTRNLLKEKERRVMERAKEDIKVLLKRSGKENQRQKILKGDDNCDLSRNINKEDVKKSDILNKSSEWSNTKRYQHEKLTSIQKARDEILKKKYESKKLHLNQIRLLGKKFLEESLQQGMEIQQQLAIIDRTLRSTQNRELHQPMLPTSQSHNIKLSSS